MQSIRILLICLCLTSKLWSIPVITSIVPSFGPETAGNIVTISGSGFTGTTVVNFGDQTAFAFIVISDNQIMAAPPVHAPGTVNVSVIADGVSAPTRNSIYTYQGGWEGVVTTSNTSTLVVLDIPSNASTPPFGFGGGLFLSAITPDARFAYITRAAANTVLVLDLANFFSASIPVGGNSQVAAINPAGTRVYVSVSATSSVKVIDTSTNTVIATIPVGATPNGLAITPDGSTLFVANTTANTVTPVNLATNTAGAPIPVAGGPNFLAITPDGSTLYVTLSTGAAVVPINVATQVVGTPIPVGPTPQGVAITPNGQTAYVVVGGNNTVVPIAIATNTAGTPISVAPEIPFQIAITPDGTLAYVGTSNNAVVVIDLLTNTVNTVVPIAGGNLSRGISITPDQAPVASFTFTSPNTFDASNSVSPTGTIVNYLWNFGDGTTLSTTSPIVNHQYANFGTYTVTLTVTNSIGTSTTQIFTGQTLSRNGSALATITQSITIPANLENFVGKVIKNKFATQTDIIHRLTWNQIADPTVLGYVLYRNGEQIAVIPSTGPLVFNDHNRRKHEVDIYTLAAFNANGPIGTPAVTQVP